MKLVRLFLFTFVLCSTIILAKKVSKTWVLLVAGSNGWYNYRHQADVCHAYQIVRAHGIPEENIIVMMYDDIANNTENRRPGIIINHPKGPDVYKGVVKDYVGEDVTSENFLKILSGDAKGMKGIGSGKVINSTKNDRIFVNFVDHGASGLLCFPGATDQLTAGQFLETLKKMRRKKKYADMVMYIEACESGSMFKNILPSNMNIFVTTAADFDESSYACYMDETLDNYLGDCYSVNWMEDTDRKDINLETLSDQFLLVKKETNTSHVKQYGTLALESLPVGEFQGEEETTAQNYPPADRNPIDSRDVSLEIMRLKLSRDQYRDKELRTSYKIMKNNIIYVDNLFKHLVVSLSNGTEQAEKWMKEKPDRIQDLDCHTNIVKKFNKKCLNLGKNTYALKYVYTLTNICNDGFSMKKLEMAFNKYCPHSPV